MPRCDSLRGAGRTIAADIRSPLLLCTNPGCSPSSILRDESNLFARMLYVTPLFVLLLLPADAFGVTRDPPKPCTALGSLQPYKDPLLHPQRFEMNIEMGPRYTHIVVEGPCTRSTAIHIYIYHRLLRATSDSGSAALYPAITFKQILLSRFQSERRRCLPYQGMRRKGEKWPRRAIRTMILINMDKHAHRLLGHDDCMFRRISTL